MFYSLIYCLVPNSFFLSLMYSLCLKEDIAGSSINVCGKIDWTNK